MLRAAGRSAPPRPPRRRSRRGMRCKGSPITGRPISAAFFSHLVRIPARYKTAPPATLPEQECETTVETFRAVRALGCEGRSPLLGARLASASCPRIAPAGSPFLGPLLRRKAQRFLCPDRHLSNVHSGWCCQKVITRDCKKRFTSEPLETNHWEIIFYLADWFAKLNLYSEIKPHMEFVESCLGN